MYTVPTRALANDKLAEWRARMAGGDCHGRSGRESGCQFSPPVKQKSRLVHGKGPDLLVVDEYQMIGDRDRGLNYELALAMAPPRTQLLLLSGSVANPDQVVKWLRRLGRDAVLVRHDVRPVPLGFSEPQSRAIAAEIKGYWPRFIATRLADDLGPVLLFAPRQSSTS